MSVVLAIAGILTLGFAVNVVLKLSYSLLFFVGGKPVLWIVTVTFVGVAVWALSAVVGWSVSVPAWACATALLMNRHPAKERWREQSVEASADAVYAEMGIRHGRILYRLGLVAFAMACLVSWASFYGEVCFGGECSVLRIVF